MGCLAQVRALALALGLMLQQGTHGWGLVFAQACKPHAPPRFWRSATRAEMKLHLLLLMQAIEARPHCTPFCYFMLFCTNSLRRCTSPQYPLGRMHLDGTKRQR